MSVPVPCISKDHDVTLIRGGAGELLLLMDEWNNALSRRNELKVDQSHSSLDQRTSALRLKSYLEKESSYKLRLLNNPPDKISVTDRSQISSSGDLNLEILTLGIESGQSHRHLVIHVSYNTHKLPFVQTIQTLGRCWTRNFYRHFVITASR